MAALDIINNDSLGVRSQIGGGGFIPHSLEWPTSSDGKKMVPILTIRPDIFLIPTMPEGMCITVFAPYEKGRESVGKLGLCARNDMSQKPSGMKVLLHKDTIPERFTDNREHYPALLLKRREYTEQEDMEEFEDDINGVYLSKVYGRPSWLQDEIFYPEKYSFTIQITEADIAKKDKRFEGIFSDGALYIYLLMSLKRMKDGEICGEAFIQFT